MQEGNAIDGVYGSYCVVVIGCAYQVETVLKRCFSEDSIEDITGVDKPVAALFKDGRSWSDLQFARSRNVRVRKQRRHPHWLFRCKQM